MKTTFALICLGLSFSASSRAERPVNKVDAQGQHRWFDSTEYRYQKSFPYLTYDPPLNTGMPLDVLIGYVYMDSLFRSATSYQATQRINSWNALNDTLFQIGKYLYELADYDPITLTKYFGDVKFSGESWAGGPTQYTCQPSLVREAIALAYEKYSPDSTKRGIYALLASDGIYNIHVVSVDSVPALQVDGAGHVFNVHARINEVIKGQQYVIDGTSETGDLITFTYSDKYGYLLNSQFDQFLPDVAFLKGYEGSDQNWPLLKIQSGQDAVVFLSYDGPLVDSSSGHFDWMLNQATSYCALPIIGGSVRDINHIWSSATLPSYSVWRGRCQNLINSLLTH